MDGSVSLKTGHSTAGTTVSWGALVMTAGRCARLALAAMPIAEISASRNVPSAYFTVFRTVGKAASCDWQEAGSWKRVADYFFPRGIVESLWMPTRIVNDPR